MMMTDVSLPPHPPERHLRNHLSHMVKDFKTSTGAKINRNEFVDFVARSKKNGHQKKSEKLTVEDVSKAVVVVPTTPYKVGEKRQKKFDPSDPPDAGALLAAWETYPAVSFARTESGDFSGFEAGAVAVAMHGHVSNAREIRALYGLPVRADSASPPLVGPQTPTKGSTRSASPAHVSTRADAKAQRRAHDAKAMPPPPPRDSKSPDVEGASLILELYLRRFEDADGDHSDQPATALAACEGSFSFVLLDNTRDAVLASRSKHSDTHPLFWGTAPRNPGESDTSDKEQQQPPTESEWDGSTLFSSDPHSLNQPCGGAAASFPLGAFYYVDNQLEYGLIQRLNPDGGRAKRKVKPMHRINSSGKVCGLGFYTESGNDLASLAGKFIA